MTRDIDVARREDFGVVLLDPFANLGRKLLQSKRR
jgi:hypothetical protein